MTNSLCMSWVLSRKWVFPRGLSPYSSKQLTPLSFSSEVRLIEGPETFLALLGGQHHAASEPRVKGSNLRTHSIIDGLEATPTNLLKIGFSAANLPSCCTMPSPFAPSSQRPPDVKSIDASPSCYKYIYNSRDQNKIRISSSTT